MPLYSTVGDTLVYLVFDRLAPVFQTSNVTGEGLDYVCLKLHLR